MNRRNFIRSSLAASAASALLLPSAVASTPAAAAKASRAGACPVGKIGALTVSRLILGSNLITFYIHSRGLKFVNNLARHYNTVDKILETLAAAEQNGINTIMTQADARYMEVLKRHRDTCGGKLQWIVSPKITGGPEDEETIRRLVDDGVAGMYVHGVQADAFCTEGRRDVVSRTIEFIKLNEIPAGVAGHDLNVIRFCEQPDVGADFYVKTFHHHQYPGGPKPEQLTKPLAEIPGYWDKDPAETAKVMRNVKKPWIAFKVMAAGAIPPPDAFKYAYDNGADFILAGMFDFEIADDVEYASAAAAGAARRPRPWLG